MLIYLLSLIYLSSYKSVLALVNIQILAFLPTARCGVVILYIKHMQQIAPVTQPWLGWNAGPTGWHIRALPTELIAPPSP